MSEDAGELPVGHIESGLVVNSAAALGLAVRARRRALGLNQLDIAGMGNTGNRFIVELEQGKPTLQLQKVLSVLDLLGLEIVVRPRTGGRG